MLRYVRHWEKIRVVVQQMQSQLFFKKKAYKLSGRYTCTEMHLRRAFNEFWSYNGLRH